MSETAPGWTPANQGPRTRRRRRYAPLMAAMTLAALAWGVIAFSGLALSAWLA